MSASWSVLTHCPVKYRVHRAGAVVGDDDGLRREASERNEDFGGGNSFDHDHCFHSEQEY